MKRKHSYFLWVLLLIALIPLFDFFKPGLPITHDGQDHVARIANFYQSLAEGNLIPRWAANLNWGFGHPILMFLYPLPSYFGSFFHFLGFSLIDSTKIVFGLGFVLSGVFMYLWVREFWGEEAGFVSGLFYMFAPYRFVNLYVRGAIGENLAFVWLPLICWFLLRLSKAGRWRYLTGGALSLTALILSHNALSLMFLPFILAYAAFLAYSTVQENPDFKIGDELNKRKHSSFGMKPHTLVWGECYSSSFGRRLSFIINCSLLIIFGLMVSAFFWLPAFLEGKYTLRDIVTAGEYVDRFRPLKDFVLSPWSYGGSSEISVQIGILHWLAFLLGFYTLFRFFGKKNKDWILVGGLILSFAAVLFLLLRVSLPVWQSVTILQKFQFPWRFLSVMVFIPAILAGSFVSLWAGKNKLWLALTAAILLLLINSNYWHAKDFSYKDGSFYSGVYAGTTDTGESSPRWSVRFMEKHPEVPLEIIGGKAEVEAVSRSTTRHEFQVIAETPARLVENTLYFPGWDIFVDGKPIEIEFQDPAHRGLMTFSLSPGKHQVVARFRETKLRLFADLVSLLGIGVLVLGSIIGDYKQGLFLASSK